MLIYKNLEHPRWTDIAQFDLECGNCTQVCPTCFCNSSYDHVQLSGISKKPFEISGTKSVRGILAFQEDLRESMAVILGHQEKQDTGTGCHINWRICLTSLA